MKPVKITSIQNKDKVTEMGEYGFKILSSREKFEIP